MTFDIRFNNEIQMFNYKGESQATCSTQQKKWRIFDSSNILNVFILGLELGFKILKNTGYSMINV